MGIFTKVTNWLYGTTPSAPVKKTAPTLSTTSAPKKAKKAPAKKTTTKKKSTVKSKK